MRVAAYLGSRPASDPPVTSAVAWHAARTANGTEQRPFDFQAVRPTILVYALRRIASDHTGDVRLLGQFDPDKSAAAALRAMLHRRLQILIWQQNLADCSFFCPYDATGKAFALTEQSANREKNWRTARCARGLLQAAGLLVAAWPR